MIDVDKELADSEQKMNDAEDELVTLGFPEDQWMLIKDFIFATIKNSRWREVKAMESLKPEDIFNNLPPTS